MFANQKTQLSAHPPGKDTASAVRSLSVSSYLLLARVFLACLILQVFFAGLGLMVHADFLAWHRSFGETTAVFLPMLMIVAALVGRLPLRLTLFTVLLLIMYLLQWLLVYAPISIAGLRILRALHPVNGLLMFWLTLVLVRHSVQHVSRRNRHEHL